MLSWTNTVSHVFFRDGQRVQTSSKQQRQRKARDFCPLCPSLPFAFPSFPPSALTSHSLFTFILLRPSPPLPSPVPTSRLDCAVPSSRSLFPLRRRTRHCLSVCLSPSDAAAGSSVRRDDARWRERDDARTARTGGSKDDLHETRRRALAGTRRCAYGPNRRLRR